VSIMARQTFRGRQNEPVILAAQASSRDASARSRHAELMIACARIGFNP